MRGVVIPGDNPDTAALCDGLGFGFKALDPRRHLKRAFALGRRMPGGKFFPKLPGVEGGQHRGHRRHPHGMRAQLLAKMRARRAHGMNAQGVPSSVVLPVHSEASAQALSDLGIKFHISRKWRKRIGIAAAVGAAAYFGGGAIAAHMASKGAAGAVAKGAGGAALKAGKKKLSAKAKKALKKAAKAGKAVAQAQILPTVPGSVAAGGGGSPFNEAGPIAAQWGITPGGEGQPDEAYGGLTATAGDQPVQEAGFGGGIMPMLLIGGLALTMLAGGGRKRRR